MTVPLPNLKGFFSGYFHQDWLTEFSGIEEIAQHLADTSPDAAVTLGELVVLISWARDREDEAVGTLLLTKMGCYGRPEEGTYLEWLVELSNLIAARLGMRLRD